MFISLKELRTVQHKNKTMSQCASPKRYITNEVECSFLLEPQQLRSAQTGRNVTSAKAHFSANVSLKYVRQMSPLACVVDILQNECVKPAINILTIDQMPSKNNDLDNIIFSDLKTITVPPPKYCIEVKLVVMCSLAST